MSRARIAIHSASTNLKLRRGAGDRKTSTGRRAFESDGEENRDELDRSISCSLKTRDILNSLRGSVGPRFFKVSWTEARLRDGPAETSCASDPPRFPLYVDADK